MSCQLTIRDTTLSGETLNEQALDFVKERISVRELIRSRVYQEVQDYNQHRPNRFAGLIQPDENEIILNGQKPSKVPLMNWRRQFARAVTAFRKKQILIFVDERQLEQLDEQIEIKPGTQVSFLRLTLLMGG